MDYLLNKSGEANVDIDPITPLEVSFTISGIGGIRMFDLFQWIIYQRFIVIIHYSKLIVFHIHYHQAGWDTSGYRYFRVDMDSLINASKILIHIKMMHLILLKIQQNKIMFHSYNLNKISRKKIHQKN